MFSFDTDTNEIFIYDEIGPAYWGLIDADMVINALKQMSGRVTVRLNTPGGSVDEGISIYNALKRHKGGVTTVVDSLAASMGSYIMQAGEKRIVASNAMVMLHKPWTIAMGNSTDLRMTADVLDKYMERQMPDFASKSGRTVEEIAAILEAETWYTAQEAVEAGFADEVSDESDVEPNALGLSKVSSKAPEQLIAIAARQQSERSQQFVKRQQAKVRAMTLAQIKALSQQKIEAALQ